MRDLVVCIRDTDYSLDLYEMIDSIKEAGFKKVFIQWYNDDLIRQQKQLDYSRKVGLDIVFAHLGYTKVSSLWIDSEEGEIQTLGYLNDLDICKENNIPLVVMHVTFKYSNSSPNKIGLKRIQRIVNHAEKLGIKVVVENVELKGYLEFLIENIKNDNFGICYDIGHSHVFFNDEFDFEKFKNKIFVIHLHDNDLSSDQHRLPFDGSIDWKNAVRNISLNYTGDIILEIGYDSYYSTIMNVSDFYKEGYNRGLILKGMFEKEDKDNLKIIYKNK